MGILLDTDGVTRSKNNSKGDRIMDRTDGFASRQLKKHWTVVFLIVAAVLATLADKSASVAQSECVGASSGAGWQNRAFTNHTGTFTVEFDATPTAAPFDSVVGLSKGAQTAYTGFAAIARFNPSGNIDARNGGAYAAASTIPYSAGVTYHIRLVINVSAHTYSIFVKPAGGAEQTVGTNFAFRTEQNSVTGLDWWGVYVNPSKPGSTTVCNFTISSDPPPTPTPSPTPTPGPGTTPVSINGQLRVCGNKLCNQYGNPIQLRGMSTHGLQWYSQCITDASLNALAQDWKADVVRISMYIQEDGYETNPRRFTDLVHSIIEKVTARGMYAIVDWHMLDPGDPQFNLNRAKTFFTEIAQRHGNKPNILYEVANEPNGVNWSRIRSYHEQIIPVIRQYDPDSVILLGTRAWSSLGVSDGASETEIINNPVRASNIMYTFHFYAASHGTSYLNTLSRAADKIPMFVTEFGTQQATGDGGNNFTRAQQYIDLMASKKISWVNWNYSDDFRSGAVFKEGACPNGPWTGTGPLKPAGVWVRDRIKTPDDFPTN